MSMSKRLSSLNEAWAGAKPADPTSAGLPPGTYQCEITALRLSEVKSGKRAGQIQFEMKAVVRAGPFKGRTVTRWMSLSDPKSLPYTKRDLETIGVELPAELTEKSIARMCKDAIGVLIEIRAAEKAGYTNYYVNRAVNDNTDGVEEEIEEDETDEAEEEEEEEEDEEEEEPAPPPKKRGRPKKQPEPEPEEDEEPEVEEEEEPKPAKSKGKKAAKSEDDDEDWEFDS